MKKVFLSILLILVFVNNINAQNSNNKAIIKKIKLIDVSPPLIDMIEVAKRNATSPFNKEYREVENEFIIHPKGKVSNTPDPLALLQKKYKSSKAQTLSVSANFDAVDNIDGVAPPDPNGDVNDQYYMQVSNSHTAIYDRTGNVVVNPFPTSDFWQGTGFDETNDGDAIILWDEDAQRWFVSQFAVNRSDGKYYELIAISQTSDPTGSYYRYAIEYQYMPDYPKAAVWPDGYYIGYNAFDMDNNGAFKGAYVTAIDRDAMLSGDASVYSITFLINTLWSVFPADADAFPAEGTPCTFVTDELSAYTGNDQVYFFDFSVNWNGASSTGNFSLNDSVQVAAYDLFNSDTEVPQKGTSGKLDLLHYRVMFRPYFRHFNDHDALVLSRTVNDGGVAAIRWYEFRKNSGKWTLYQQGTYNPGDGLWRWMPSIAINAWGDIALGYSVSSSSKYPSIRIVARRESDPLGVMTTDEIEYLSGSASQDATSGGNPVTRWGDYTMLSIDPDDFTFWYVGEYTSGGWNWKTRIAHFSCETSVPSISNVSDNTIYKDKGKQITISGSNLSGSTFDIGGVQGTIIGGNNSEAVVLFPPGNYSNNTLTVTNSSGSDTYTMNVLTRNTIPVVAGSDNTSDNHPTIQSAVDGLYAWYGNTAFDSGDLPGTKTIEVYAGTYSEEITLNSNLNPVAGNILVIENNPGDEVVIDATDNDYGFNLNTVDYVTLKGFSVHDATIDNIYVQGNYANIQYNKTYNAGNSGIDISTGSNNTISNNLIYGNNVYGIKINSSNNNIINNTIDNNGHSYNGLLINTYTFSESVDILDKKTVYADINVPDNVTITKVRVLNMNITHTYDKDLDISLLHPDKTEVILSSKNGGSGDNYTNTNFDDDASNSITDGSAPFTGTFKPEGTLSDFNGKASNGTWQLKVTDNYNGDEGTIDSWTLEITYIANINEGAGIYIADVTGNNLKNNIIVAKSGNDNFYALESPGNSVTSDYNNYFTSNQYLFDFNGSQDNTGPKGANDISSDPLFVGSGDYHIQSDQGSYHEGEWPPLTVTVGTWINDASTSPSLDAGDPSDSYSNEPSSGDRINQGAYGNTPQASKTFNGKNITWTGNIDDDWQTTGNWDLGTIPTGNDNVTIPEGLTNYPLINDGTITAVCNNLTIENNASLTIAPNGQMSINGDITNNSGTSGIIIQSDASGTGSFIQNSSTAVEATVQRFLSATTKAWHMFTAPISNADISTILPTTNNFFYYDENANDYWSSGTYSSGSENGWTEVSSGTMDVQKGYLYNFFETTLNFAGTLNSSSAGQNIPIVYTDNGVTAPNGTSYNDFDGWNLIANPFTSAIDWTAVDAHSANLYDAIYVWDAINKTYKSYVSGTDSYNGASTNGGSQYIPAMQGFFVKVNENLGTNGTLNIPASARVHNSQPFWKKTISNNSNNYLDIFVDANGNTDETVIRLLTDATKEIDNHLDAYKLFSNVSSASQIYTTGIDNNTEYSINSLPFIKKEFNVPLKVIVSSDKFSLTFKNINFDNYKIYLKNNDNLIELTQDQTKEFNTEGNENKDRFAIVFEPKQITSLTKINNSIVSIYPNPNNGIFLIRVLDNKNKDYKLNIVNSLGKIVFSQTFTTNNYNQVNIENLPSGIYSVWIINGDLRRIEKVIIQ